MADLLVESTASTVRILGRLRTLGALFSHFARREKLVLIPLLTVLLLAGLLLVATTGASKIAPFVYTLF